MTRDATLRLEDFIQAVQSQLDNAQAAMAIKARNLNLPLTFAIKDINLDLRAHVEFADSEIRIRPAAAGEKEASVFHLVFTAITRPAIEENAIALADDPDDQPLDELEAELTSEERKRLEWAGVRTVKQLQDARERGAVHTIGRVTNLPVERLRKALERASEPLVQRVEPVRPELDASPGAPPLIRVTGRNLVRGNMLPQVKIGRRPVSILKSSPNELLLAPGDDQWAGELAVEAAPLLGTAMSFDLSAFAPQDRPIEPIAAPAIGIAAIPPVETRQ
ncbi:hypothetical protein D1610_00115 [Sphingomonas gilva]|uniref:Uncharacterized protein n=1 Tax=Sphingomonas gilva TaxID=2305907 RepID=A0A396RQ87_9SPHN|nr:hypothetical protein [Sphingomonas gilva]RHW18618.1 hypothetical protein D1610_00115 [Sphingomonas gilva]